MLHPQSRAVESQHVSRWQFSYVREDRAVRGRVEERQVVIERRQIEVPGNVRRTQDRLELGGEVHAPRRFGDVERFDADPVARYDERARLPVPDGPDVLAMLDRYDIVVSLTAVYEWGGYRYSSAKDAIAAAKRGSIADGAV